MKRLNVLRMTAIALVIGTVACERSSQAPLSQSGSGASEQSHGTDPSNALGADNLSGDRASTVNASGDGTSALSPTPIDENLSSDSLSSLGLSAKYKKSRSSKVRPTRVVTAGRPNPFHAVHQPRVEVTYAETAIAPQPSTPNVAPTPTEAVLYQDAKPATQLPEVPRVQPLPPIPAIAFGEPTPTVTRGLPVVQPVTLVPAPPSVLPVPAVPPLAIPPSFPSRLETAKPISPTAMAEAIEIKGLVQVGDQINLIIKDPATETSRTVQIGDFIGGGQVKVSRIDTLESQEPQVVLEQNGVEVVRSIGV